jgi:hypothetical protein
MKSHKNQWIWSIPCPLEHLSGAISRVQTMVSGVQTPSQYPDTGLSPEKCAYKPLRIKYFHGVSTGNQHPYLLKSRYGKVRLFLPLRGEGLSCPGRGRGR